MPQAAHDVGEVLHLGSGDLGDAVGVKHRRDAPADAKHVTAAGQPVHGGGMRGGHQRVAGVVVGGGSHDANVVGHRTDRPRDGGGLLQVEALRDEHGAKAQFLSRCHLLDELPGRIRRTGQSVETQFGQLLGVSFGHLCTINPQLLRGRRYRR